MPARECLRNVKSNLPFQLLFQYRGSIFPLASLIAFPSGIFALLLKTLQIEGLVDAELGGQILGKAAVYSGFTFLIGFFVVFRTTQAYYRFWDGVTTTKTIQGQLFDTHSCFIAYCKAATCGEQDVLEFLHLMMRLISLLHAVMLDRVTDDSQVADDLTVFDYKLIDILGVDMHTLLAVHKAKDKVEIVFQWIQLLMSKHTTTGVLAIAGPILSRAFQQLANAKVSFEDTVKLDDIPFPFPFAQTTSVLLLFHWLLCPFVMCQWVEWRSWCAVFTFLQVFTLWVLNLIAEEMEQPFGTDFNDLNTEFMQEEMNEHLQSIMMKQAWITPHLAETYEKDVERLFSRRKTRLRASWTTVHASIWTDLIDVEQDLTRKQSNMSSASDGKTGLPKCSVPKPAYIRRDSHLNSQLIAPPRLSQMSDDSGGRRSGGSGGVSGPIGGRDIGGKAASGIWRTTLQRSLSRFRKDEDPPEVPTVVRGWRSANADFVTRTGRRSERAPLPGPSPYARTWRDIQAQSAAHQERMSKIQAAIAAEEASAPSQEMQELHERCLRELELKLSASNDMESPRPDSMKASPRSVARMASAVRRANATDNPSPRASAADEVADLELSQEKRSLEELLLAVPDARKRELVRDWARSLAREEAVEQALTMTVELQAAGELKGLYRSPS
eukprot:gnl/TRDRNA2_/TRDRNA2_186076_c0_seq1.p1 gnl/TRDRNA2_/TRDRNA2_186076_c0~~gnl/TRDRNA2_/TRDRNA2_186076_c0_seq1.p1  ORF type:complete len:668 (+),score=116.20 gnl/TRDRNA2_/TRDRNA2_186076_c0_seq1:123-2126(+)